MGCSGLSPPSFLMIIYCQSQFGPVSFHLPSPSLMPFPFSSIHESVGMVGLAAVVAHVPDCFLGQTSRRRAWGGKKGKNIECSGKRGRRSCSSTEPLQLFKWPLSLCTCSLGSVWILKWLPPKTPDNQKMKPTQRAKGRVFLTLPSLDANEPGTRLTEWLWTTGDIFLSRLASIQWKTGWGDRRR